MSTTDHKVVGSKVQTNMLTIGWRPCGDHQSGFLNNFRTVDRPTDKLNQTNSVEGETAAGDKTYFGPDQRTISSSSYKRTTQ